MKNGKTISLIFCIILISIFLISCQETPKNEIIVNKGDNLKTVIETQNEETKDDKKKTIEFIPIVTPENVYEDKKVFKNMSVTINANVVVPQVSAYPVTEVGKKVFSDEFIMDKIKKLSGSDIFYKEWISTKDEMLEKLTNAKKNIGTGNVTQEYINILQGLYDTAPTEYSNIEFDINDYEEGEEFFVFATNSSNKTAYFVVIKGENSFYYEKDKDLSAVTQSMGVESDWSYPKKQPQITREEAYKVAEQCMKDMSADLKLFNTELCSITENGINKHTGWMFTFTREIGGLQGNFSLDSFYVNPLSAPSVGASWMPETLKIYVDEGGVQKIDWQGASEVTKTLADNVHLETFDMIKQRAVEQLNFNYGTDNPEDRVIDFTITEFNLGLSLLPVEDNSNLGMYTPTWCVSFENQDETGYVYKKQIMFNAIDGSYIEPRITNKQLMEYLNSNTGF